VGGVGVALLAAKVDHLAANAALPVGIAAAVVLFGLHLLYQQQRARDRVLPATGCVRVVLTLDDAGMS
jgi:hypothetical protein